MLTDDYKRRIAAELKLEPLINIDPNDQQAINSLVATAVSICNKFTIDSADAKTLKLMALSVNQWGDEFYQQAWAEEILKDDQETDLQKLQELHLYNLFGKAGPTAIDFPAYCILKYRRRVPNHEYEPAEIHVASEIGLEIAKKAQINDMLNSYNCVELVLIIGGNFLNNPLCDDVAKVFARTDFNSDEKIDFAYRWLNENFDTLLAAMQE